MGDPPVEFVWHDGLVPASLGTQRPAPSHRRYWPRPVPALLGLPGSGDPA